MSEGVPSSTTPCAEPGCTNTFVNHRWGKVKADDWFHQRDGACWCPEHIPAWVEGWRAAHARSPEA